MHVDDGEARRICMYVCMYLNARMRRGYLAGFGVTFLELHSFDAVAASAFNWPEFTVVVSLGVNRYPTYGNQSMGPPRCYLLKQDQNVHIPSVVYTVLGIDPGWGVRFRP